MGRNLASQERREGVFIGSFDPFTKGHMSIVLASVKDLSLDKIHIQVNSLSNKDYSASIAERIELIKKSIEKYHLDVEVEIAAEPLEGKRKFVQNLHQKTGADIYQVMGADVLEKSDDLFGDLEFVKRYVARRLDDDSLANINFKDNQLASKVEFLDVKAKAISSSRVKEMLKNGEIPSAYLEPEVIDLIVKNKLYEFPSNETMQAKKNFLTLYYLTYMKQIKELVPNLYLPLYEDTQNIQFTWSQSSEGFLEHLVRVVLKENKDLTKEQKEELWKKSRSIYSSEEIKELIELYDSDISNIVKKAHVFYSSFESIDNEMISEVEKILSETNDKVVFAIDANYLKASKIPGQRQRELESLIEERFIDNIDRFEINLFENSENADIVENFVNRKFGVRSKVTKISRKIEVSDVKFKFDGSLLKEVEGKLLEMEKRIQIKYESLNDEGFSLDMLYRELNERGENSSKYIKEWEKENISYQKMLDDYYAYNFDYQVLSSKNEFEEALNQIAKNISREKRAELLKYKERIDLHFSEYFLNKENYGAKKDVLRVDHLQGYFKSLRDCYSFMNHEPVISLNSKLRGLIDKLSKKFDSFLKEMKLLPEKVNLLYTYYIQKSKAPKDAVSALNRYFKKKAKLEGVNIKVYDDLSNLTNTPNDVVTIFSPNHVQGDMDGMIMGELQRDNSLLFAARSRMKWRQKLFDQVPDSNLIVVGGESDPVEDVLSKIKSGNSKEVYIYPEGHFAGMTGETRVPKIGFSAGFLRKLKMDNIKYQIVPLTFQGSAGVIGDLGNIKGREISVNAGKILDAEMTSFIDQSLKSRTFYNTFVRANWLEQHSISSDNIHGSPSVKKLKLILGKYQFGEVDSCHEIMKSILIH